MELWVRLLVELPWIYVAPSRKARFRARNCVSPAHSPTHRDAEGKQVVGLGLPQVLLWVHWSYPAFLSREAFGIKIGLWRTFFGPDMRTSSGGHPMRKSCVDPQEWENARASSFSQEQLAKAIEMTYVTQVEANAGRGRGQERERERGRKWEWYFVQCPMCWWRCLGDVSDFRWQNQENSTLQ